MLSAARRSLVTVRHLHASASLDKKYDVVVWGCTGFTGKLITEYIARTAPSRSASFQWAIVGRDKAKVESVHQAIAQATGAPCKADVLVSNTNDQASVDKVVANTKVVICSAGPFITCAVPIVDACVRLGADYVDITGETPFAKKVIDSYHERAVANNVLIVSMCGFDSIPSDLGTWMVTKAIRERYGQATKHVSSYMKMRGALSGGTINTGITLELMGPEVVAQMKDQYLLGGIASKPAEKDADTAEFSEDVKAWTAPFMMGPINTRVVRRSSMLFEQKGAPYGPQFTYSERCIVPNEAAANKLVSPMPDAAVRKKMVSKGVLPKPGEGPDAEQRAKSSFELTLVGVAEDGHKVIGTVAGGDPGYGETSKMVAEAGMLLALNRPSLPARGGVVTPAFAFGQVLIDRLNGCGLTFKVAP